MDSPSYLQDLPNPYDFTHPVRDPTIFSGRQDLIAELQYYLDHALTDARPTNLALLGPRASGKTSILNMVELEARERNFCVCRINLNEADVSVELFFFHKLFDAIFNAACDTPFLDSHDLPTYPFEGRDGRTYEAYEDMMTSYQITPNRKWRPFSFPVSYAKSMSANNHNANVSDSQFVRDLSLIYTELEAPIVIIIDEGNLLAANRSMLQKIRNIFMNLPGYMIVISGTLDLFPVMDEVFSPISRDFKRFTVGTFNSRSEAEDCVIKPLSSIGIDNPISLFDRETLVDLVDPRGLAAFSPYQIQLICHYLFKNMQQSSENTMVLSVDVLNEVLSELVHGSDIRNSSVIAAIQALSDTELTDLGELCSMNGFATLDEVWALQRLAYGADDDKRTEMNERLNFFRDSDLISIDGGRIKFSGDDREAMYAKYYAKKRGVMRLISEVTPEVLLPIAIQASVVVNSGWSPSGITTVGSPTQDFTSDFLYRVADAMIGIADIDDVLPVPSRTLSRDLVMELYFEFCEAIRSSKGLLIFASVSLSSSWLNRHLFFNQSIEDEVPEVEKTIANFESVGRDLAARAGDFDLAVSVDMRPYRVPLLDDLAGSMASIRDMRLRRMLARVHFETMVRYYVDSRDLQLAAKHRDWSYRFNPEPSDMRQVNDLAYVFLSGGESTTALTLLKSGSLLNGDRVLESLIALNLGVAYLSLGQFDSAGDQFRRALDLAVELDSDEQVVSCLLQPEIIDGAVKLEEIWEPNIVTVGEVGLRVAEEMSRLEEGGAILIDA